MKKIMSMGMVAAMVLVACGMAQAEVATAYVATANANYAFEVRNGGDQLYYATQPDTENNWYYVNGDMVYYTYGGVTAPRDGMKTYASTDIAYGQPIGSVALQFQYASSTGTDNYGFPYGNYPGINVCITDGSGTYAIWSATSGGTGFTTAPVAGREGWEQLTLDMRTFQDTDVYGKINESTNTSVLLNGNLNATSVSWGDIKDWTIAGFYTEQFNPTGGFGAWCDTLWDTITDPTNPTGPQNEYGITLFWGDTVGSMYGDGNGEVGAAAERDYGKKSKLIDHFMVTVGTGAEEEEYCMQFAPGVVSVPEPSTLVMFVLGGLSLLLWKRRA